MAENFMTAIFPVCSRKMWVVPVGVMSLPCMLGGTFIKQLHDLYKKVALVICQPANDMFFLFFVFQFRRRESAEKIQDV